MKTIAISFCPSGLTANDRKLVDVIGNFATWLVEPVASRRRIAPVLSAKYAAFAATRTGGGGIAAQLPTKARAGGVNSTFASTWPRVSMSARVSLSACGEFLMRSTITPDGAEGPVVGDAVTALGVVVGAGEWLLTLVEPQPAIRSAIAVIAAILTTVKR